MKRFIFRFLLIGFLLVMLGTILAQFPKVKLKIPKKIPGLDKILKSEPAITTSILDAVTEVPFLDDYNPKVFMPMSILPRTPEGGFVLEAPGNYMFDSQSYCLKAGTYAPGSGRGGDGYLYAPQKGPQVNIVRNILQRSFAHPDIPQRDIQVLLWAIIARTKISDMSRQMQLTAAKLLKPEEIFRLNGGALGLIPKSLTREAFKNLPPAARQVLEAEARLREMLTKTQAPYEELERIAVLRGDPPPQEGDREVPLGRWSFHPDGYFIRYFPRGYQQILIELSVPEFFNIEYDERGRITLIADGYGNRIETEYDDTLEPLNVPGERTLRGYGFRSIRFEHPDPDNPGEKLQTEWNDVGWTFIGVPVGRGKIGTFSNRFVGLSERYQWCRKHKKELDGLSQGLKKISRRNVPRHVSQHSMEEIMALGHYATALKEVINSSDSNKEDWIVDPINLVKKAWQYEVSEREGPYLGRYISFQGPLYAHVDCSAGLMASINPIGHLLTYNNPGRDGGDKPVYNPCGGMAQPGKGGRQRLNQSGRETDKEKCRKKAREKLKDAIDDCYRRNNIAADCDLQALMNCVKLYPKGRRHMCVQIHCPIPDNMDDVASAGLALCIIEALKAWLKNDEKCK